MQGYDGHDAELYDGFYAGYTIDIDFYVNVVKDTKTAVLDLACGTGRIMLPLLQSGIHVVGIDLSQDMLHVARRKIEALPKEMQKQAQLIQADMRSFELNAKFDYIIIPFRSFMHLSTRNDQKLALRQIHKHLTEGGKLIFDTFGANIRAIAAHNEPLGWALKKDDVFTIDNNPNIFVSWESQKYLINTQILEVTYIIDELDEVRTVVSRRYSELSLRWTTRYEMENLLELCGFVLEHLYGGFEKQNFYPGLTQVWFTRKGNPCAEQSITE